MLVRWSGEGCLVGPLLLAGVLLSVAVQNVFDGNRWVTDAGWVLGFVVSAILIRRIGTRLNRRDGDQHTLYDLPMQNFAWLGWACAVLALGIVVLFRLSPRG